MKLKNVFKLLVDISFYFLVPVIFFMPGAILYFLIFPEQQIVSDLPFSNNGVGWLTGLTLFLLYVEYALFFVGFYNLRKFAAILLKNKLFTKGSIDRTKRAGQFFSICGASSIILKIVYAFTDDRTTRIEFGVSNLQLLIFLVIIGLFFLILSKAFAYTRALEEEQN